MCACVPDLVIAMNFFDWLSDLKATLPLVNLCQSRVRNCVPRNCVPGWRQQQDRLN